MATFELRISSKIPSTHFQAAGRDFIIALRDWLKDRPGGECHGIATETAVTAQIGGAEREEVTQLADSFLRRAARVLKDLEVVITEGVARPLTKGEKDLAGTLNMKPVKLTRNFLLSLTEGRFVASNLMATPHMPLFAETVASDPLKAEQWKRVLESGAAQHLCHVFRNREDFLQWLKGRVG